MNKLELIFIGIIIGALLSFFILVPKAKKYQESIICKNGEVVSKAIGEHFITYERINGDICEELK